jgi:spore maturation protein CgeB
MKLILIGSDHVWSLEKIYFKYLKELDVEVELFPAQNYFYEYYNHSTIHKIFYRVGVSSVIKKINQQLIDKILAFKPTIAWIFKGMEILPATLEFMKRQGVLLVNYNPDNPFLFSGAGSGNDNISKSISLYDLHLTYNLDIKTQLEKKGYRTRILPFGFDLSEEVYAMCCTQNEIVKVCFLGNPDRNRAEFIQSLAEAGIEIDIYGKEWNKYINHPRIQTLPPVFGEEFWRVLRRYRIQLNVMRPHNGQSHNMRSFEIPAAGGIMLAPDNEEHRSFFINGHEIYLYSDLPNCLKQVRTIISLPLIEVGKVRQNARNRSLRSGYSYIERTQTVLEYLRAIC